MHILYLHQYFVPPDGNSGTRSYEMSRRLVRAGHKVTLVTSSAGFPGNCNMTKGLQNMILDGIELRVLHVPYSNRFSYPKRILAFFQFSLKAVLQVMKERKVDLVFATSTPLTIVIPGLVAKIRHRCPMVFEVRDLWPEIPIAVKALRNPVVIRLARWLEKLAYRNSAQVVALSPGMADGVAKSGYPSDRISVIPNSCDVDLFQGPESKSRKFFEDYPQLLRGPLVTYAGKFGLINGVEYLAEIASEMAKIDLEINFLAIGFGREEENISQRARNLQVLDKNFWLLPPVSKKNLPQVLKATTVAISLVIDLPELWNNSANKFFDALAAGCPVAINYRGWQAEFIEKTGAGLVIPPHDPRAAAQQLQAYIRDEKKLERGRQAATEAAYGIFNRDRLAKELERVFRVAV